MREDLQVILASGSPRRKELLEKAGVKFRIIVSTAEEIHDPKLGMAGLCETNACLKAEAVAKENPGAAVIGADTLVFVDDMALGKPKDLEEAEAMLARLSGRTHKVCTGVCIAGPAGALLTFHQATKVIFKKLDDETISTYLKMTRPLDKAGAYGIQDQGEMIVERIDGGFDNVMGLPVERLLTELDRL